MNEAWKAMAAAGAVLAASVAAAQGYPDRPVRMIVPFPPGGNIDITARAVAPGLSEGLGQSIVIDNRPGAGGTIGNDVVAKAAPDGYVILLNAPTVTAAVYPKLPYDLLRDFTTVGLVNTVPLLIVVHPSLRARTVKELIGLARARPGVMTYATAGLGTTNHLSGELFQSLTGTRLVHVPYKGSGPALIDILGGQVDIQFDQITSAMPHVQSGKTRALAITSERRSKVLPDVPTLAEAGVPGYEAATTAGVLTPAGVSREIVDRLSVALNRVLAQEAIQSRFLAMGAEPLRSTPEEYARQLRTELEKWRRVVKQAGIKLD